MQVETYEVTETMADGTEEQDSEALELIESLGLEGQKTMISDRENGTGTRFPYRKMTKEEAVVYGQLMPRKTDIEKYSDGPIPLRVLQVAAHVKEMDFLDGVEVWHPRNADEKDPVLVGTRRVPGDFGSTTERYILARWGEELAPFKILCEKAVEKWQSACVEALKAIEARANALLSTYAVAGLHTMIEKDGQTPSAYLS